MSSNHPRISIGMPVYNGENFLQQGLDSILAQTYEAFELVISDNASTDRTEEICRAYAQNDRRIRYYRHENNRGPAWNYNYVFELSTGEYFKWSAHDDLYTPDFLSKCVEVLDRDSTVVLCYSKTKFIDENGKILSEYSYHIDTDHPKPQERFRSLVCVNHKVHAAVEIFGLTRTAILKTTPLIGYYARGDSVLLVQLSLFGRFYEIPEYLFFNRDHSNRSVKEKQFQIARGRTRVAQLIGAGPLPPTEWFDPSKKGRIVFPEWRLLWEYFVSIQYGSLSIFERAMCYLYLTYWLGKHFPKLVRDLLIATEQALIAPWENPEQSQKIQETVKGGSV